ncbi:thioredoxin family protein [Crocinitomix catalasitica]|uniref:thioredoxin family protein n=1 Tax=Crocinitomix catalasitica TaxID=184607 RepID=UPI00055C4050|nr:thioredoxin family protein [Crocinitomix catalasitica]
MTTYNINEYLALISDLLAQDKTTGTNHAPDMINYTKLNSKRLNRWLAKGELLPESISAIRSIDTKQTWTVITEAWCGDAAHSIGFISKLAELNDNIELNFVLRDENLPLIDKYLTNGGRSIPKLIVRDEKGEDIFDWGPRPAAIQAAYLEMRANELPYADISIELQKLYNADKGVSIQNEIIQLLALKPIQ